MKPSTAFMSGLAIGFLWAFPGSGNLTSIASTWVIFIGSPLKDLIDDSFAGRTFTGSFRHKPCILVVAYCPKRVKLFEKKSS
jgi:hypothetical protein